MTRVAILDDYQRLALSVADWSILGAGVSIQPFHDRIGSEEILAERLRNFDVIVAMRERTPFPATLLERLPALKLLVTTGRRNAFIDVAAASARGIVVSGTSTLSTLLVNHPLRRLENALLTPHLGYVTSENYRLAYGEAIDDIRAFLAGTPVRVMA